MLVIAIIIVAIIAPSLLLYVNIYIRAALTDNSTILTEWSTVSNQILWATLSVSTVGVLFMLVAIITPYVLGWVRRPILDIAVGQTSGTGRSWRFLHLTIFNRPISGLFKFVERRDMATGCKVRLSFIPVGTNQLQFKPIFAKWDAQPEPLRLTPVGANLRPVVEASLIVVGHTYNLEPSDDGADVAVAVKHTRDTKAYAFNSFSYYYAGWKKPNWALPPGEYLIQATAMSGQQSCTKMFRLLNRGRGFRNFRLELSS